MTKAKKLLEELQTIPKLIEALKLDIEQTEAILLTSPRLSDTKTIGGLRQRQDDKIVKVIDRVDKNKAEIERLLDRKEEIYSIINQLEPKQRLLIITAYVNCEYPTEAMDKLHWGSQKYYTIRRQAFNELDKILNAQ